MHQEIYSECIARRICSYLYRNEYGGTIDRRLGMIQFFMKSDSFPIEIEIVIQIHTTGYLVMAMYPFELHRFCEREKWITKMNRYLQYASENEHSRFETIDDGGSVTLDVAYMYKVECRDGCPADETIENSILIPFGKMEQYGPGIRDIYDGEKANVHMIFKRRSKCSV